MINVGKPVIGRNFLGRSEELELLKQYMRMGQSVTVIAPRRYGKTSLVLQALSHLKKEGCYTAFLDVFSTPTLYHLSRDITAEVLANHGLKNSFDKLQKNIKELMKSVELKTTIESFDYILSFAEGVTEDEWTLFGESLDFVDRFAGKHDKKIVCAFDEFGEIKKFDRQQEVIKMVRSHIQLQEHATYIFSGSYESVMQSMFVSRNSPFYRMTHIIRLGKLDHTVLLKHFTKVTKQLAIKVNKAQIESFLDISGGHPYYAQLTLQQLLLFQIQHQRIPTQAELLDELLAMEKDYLEKNWEELSSNKEYVFVLRHLAESPTGVYGSASRNNINASRALNALEGMGVIFKSGQEYHFYDPIFELWIARYIN